jgi:Mor family transcriptional regulator
VETFWLGLLPVEAKPAGRPRRNAMRDAAIFKLAKTHSRKELQRDFHISQSRIAQIVRCEQTYIPRAGEEKP